MDKITTQKEYINYLNDTRRKHSYYNKIKFINEYTNYLYNFEGLNILNYNLVKNNVKKCLKGFKPLTSTIKI